MFVLLVMNKWNEFFWFVWKWFLIILRENNWVFDNLLIYVLYFINDIEYCKECICSYFCEVNGKYDVVELLVCVICDILFILFEYNFLKDCILLLVFWKCKLNWLFFSFCLYIWIWCIIVFIFLINENFLYGINIFKRWCLVINVFFVYGKL